MNQEIEKKLLHTNSLNDFRKIILENRITKVNELSEAVL